MHLLVALLMALSWSFVLSEVQKTFEQCSEFFTQGQPPVIPNILKPNEDDDRFKKICQKYDLKYTFATFYDTENRIPVFSAYKYTGRANIRRPNIPWKIEPQLDPPVPDMTIPYRHQAINDDYFEKRSTLNRGHLFPYGFVADEITGISTFTLTNSVPQYIAFNKGGWNNIERETSQNMDENCRGENGQILAHVLTGAVPGNNKLNNRVNIPSYMWMAFCCYNATENQWVSRVYWAKNEVNSFTNNYITSLNDLQQTLSQTFGENVQLFKDNCEKNTPVSIRSKKIFLSNL